MNGPILFLSILLSTLTDATFALMVGLLLADHWLAVPAFLSVQHTFSERSARRLMLALIFLLILAHLARPWFLASSMSGSSSFRDNIALIPSILSSTHQGKLWYINSCAIVLLLLATLARPSLRGSIRWRSRSIITILALALIAAVKAASGHAADDGDFTLMESVQVLHILATAVWSGSILVSGFFVLPLLVRRVRPDAIWSYGEQLSRFATYAVITVLLSGVYTSDRELNGPLAGLWTTLWGKVLLAKIAVVLIAFAFGGASRFTCLAKDASAPRLQLLARLLLSEAVAMAVILCLSGWLGNTSPAMSAGM
ncbi:hypothetical protein FTO74_14940 [Granulicella sp. WH15]|uniref:copper resistance D family protein n=1 Tax=Granulicella sp. WH15 TaxID=2602070 RepID=UPI0013676C6B|nr:CopD family protein [Granulicella sp. WH15]QHN04513.1 hypothetical protein FTO74_14940 [Granulicella sp. WH15]